MKNYKCINNLIQKLSDAADEIISCADDYYNHGSNTPFRALISDLQDEHGFDDCYVSLLSDMIKEREPYSFIEIIGDEIFIHHDQELEEENIIIDPHSDAPDFTERMLNIPGINPEMLPDWIQHIFEIAIIDEEEGVPQETARETSLNEFAETFEKVEQHYSGTAALIFNYKSGYVAHEIYGAAVFIAGGGNPAEAYDMAENGAFEDAVEPDVDETPGMIME